MSKAAFRVVEYRNPNDEPARQNSFTDCQRAPGDRVLFTVSPPQIFARDPDWLCGCDVCRRIRGERARKEREDKQRAYFERMRQGQTSTKTPDSGPDDGPG